MNIKFIRLVEFVIVAFICMICLFGAAHISDVIHNDNCTNFKIKQEVILSYNLKHQLSDIDTLDNDYRISEMSYRIASKQAEEYTKEKRIQSCKHKLNILANMTDCKERYEYYKLLLSEYPDLIVQKETIYNNFTEDEIYLICRVVESEAGGGDFGSKSHVAEVIFNRCNYERFGKNITEVITRPGQFYYKQTRISEDTLDAVEYAYLFETEVKGAIYFQKGKRNKWSKQPFILKDDIGHCFYGPKESTQTNPIFAEISDQLVLL